MKRKKMDGKVLAAKLMAAAPVYYDSILETLPEEGRYESLDGAIQRLDGILEKAARVRGYGIRTVTLRRLRRRRAIRASRCTRNGSTLSLSGSRASTTFPGRRGAASPGLARKVASDD